VGLVRKVELLSASLSLKTVVVAEPSDQIVPARILRFFSLQNPHTFCKKKFSRPILRFLTNFEVDFVAIKDSNQKMS